MKPTPEEGLKVQISAQERLVKRTCDKLTAEKNKNPAIIRLEKRMNKLHIQLRDMQIKLIRLQEQCFESVSEMLDYFFQEHSITELEGKYYLDEVADENEIVMCKLDVEMLCGEIPRGTRNIWTYKEHLGTWDCREQDERFTADGKSKVLGPAYYHCRACDLVVGHFDSHRYNDMEGLSGSEGEEHLCRSCGRAIANDVHSVS